MKFLIIRFSSIGDIVLTTPVIRCLKKQIVTAEVHYLTKFSFRSLVEFNPYIDKCHYLENDISDLLPSLIAEDFDYVIDLHNNVRTIKVKNALGKKSFSFNKLNIPKWLYTNFKINRMPDIHIVDRYLDTVKEFGIKNDGAGLDYFIPEKDEVSMSDIPASHHAGYIGLVIGAALNTKKYPRHKLEAFCSEIDHPVILLGGKEDVEDGQIIAASDPQKIYNSCGKFGINESADLVRKAKLIITNDTGLMHIATAFKKPVISLWGNTVPEFGMYPYYGGRADIRHFGKVDSRSGKEIHSEKEGWHFGKQVFAGHSKEKSDIENSEGDATGGSNSKEQKFGRGPYLSIQNNPLFDILEIRNLSCRPCSKIGFKKCPRGHFKCMELIDTASLIQAMLVRLGRVKT